MSQGNDDKAGFNMAIASLIRVDNILKFIQSSALSEDFEVWEKSLRQLRREISPYIKSTELEKLTKSLKELKEIEWVKVDDFGRKQYVEKEIDKAEEMLDSITIDCQKAMFAAGILMAIKNDESSGGYD